MPPLESDLVASTDASDAVILHLWQATQAVIDLAVSLCVARGLGTPQNYADASAAGFRYIVAHAYEQLDMARVHRAASSDPSDLRAFVRILGQLTSAAK